MNHRKKGRGIIYLTSHTLCAGVSLGHDYCLTKMYNMTLCRDCAFIFNWMKNPLLLSDLSFSFQTSAEHHFAVTLLLNWIHNTVVCIDLWLLWQWRFVLFIREVYINRVWSSTLPFWDNLGCGAPASGRYTVALQSPLLKCIIRLYKTCKYLVDCVAAGCFYFIQYCVPSLRIK
jgi:hypothetical protein